jgi:hypothetical protein
MAFTQLRTDYADDVLNENVNTNVRYIETDNGDGTVSLQDATAYTTMGDQLSASVLNGIGAVVNAIGAQVTANITDIDTNANDISTNTADITNLKAGKIDLNTSAQAGTIDGDLYAAIVALGWESDVID